MHGANPNTLIEDGTDVTFLFRNGFAAWPYRRKITFHNADPQSSELENFPVPILLDDQRIDYAQFAAAGRDLFFVDDDGRTVLAHEIEKWDPSGTSVVWVRVPHLAHTDQDFIWMVYGDLDVTDSAENPSGVWDENFVGVWHLANGSAEDPNKAVVSDSSVPRLNGVFVDNPLLAQVGMFGDLSVAFDGTNYVDLSTFDVLPAATPDGLSLEVVALVQAGSGDWSRMISKADGSSTNSHWWMLSLTNPGLNVWSWRLRIRPDDSTTQQLETGQLVSQDTWFYVAATYDGNTMRVYHDGQTAGTKTLQSSSPLAADGTIQVGVAANPSPFYQGLTGLISEVRVSNLARSGAFFFAQNKALQDRPDQPFVILGPQENNR